MDEPIDARESLKRVDIPTLDKERAALRERIVGQEDALDSLATLYIKLKSGIRATGLGPIDIKFLAGPSGVGKTESVYALADLMLNGTGNAMDKVIKINGGEYQPEQRHNISRLIGAPPGYRGSEDRLIPGSGSEVVFAQENLNAHRIFYTDGNGQRRSVIFLLIDEAEKADISFHRLFLSILDKGELDLANNKKANFSDVVIFYTSNVGNERVERMHQGQQSAGSEREWVLLSEEDKKVFREEFIRAFPPEFRGRTDEIIVYNHLNKENAQQIALMKLENVKSSFAANGIKIDFDLSPGALEWLVKNGYSRSEGARAMGKLIDKTIYDSLVKLEATREADVIANGVHRKRIGIDIKEDGSGLDFYFGEGYQLEDFTHEELQKINMVPDKEGIPSLPAQYKSDLMVAIEKGPKEYTKMRDQLAKDGLIDADVANLQPEIRAIAAKTLLGEFNSSWIDRLAKARKELLDAGIFTADQIDDATGLKERIKIKLTSILKNSVSEYAKYRDDYVKAGIGSREGWDQLILMAKAA